MLQGRSGLGVLFGLPLACFSSAPLKRSRPGMNILATSTGQDFLAEMLGRVCFDYCHDMMVLLPLSTSRLKSHYV